MNSTTLQSALSAIETPQVDTIKAGGPSNSELLNRLRGGITHDLLLLDQRTHDQGAALSQALTLFNTQLAALTSRINSLDSRIPTASGRWLVDFYSDALVDADNTAEINTVYGQATLPILSSQEKLVAEDSDGQVWIPRGAALQYYYGSETPHEHEWLDDPNGRFALDQRSDTVWWRDRGSAGDVWVRIRLPANLSANRLCNCLILHPFPVLVNNLIRVEYRSPAGVWTEVDLTYLSEWRTGLDQATAIGNLRLFFPASQVVEMRLKLRVSDLWGFQKVSVRHIEFDANATLVANLADYAPGSIGSVVVGGRDPDALAYLSTTITNVIPPDGPLIAVALLQNASNQSPIITRIEALR